MCQIMPNSLFTCQKTTHTYTEHTSASVTCIQTSIIGLSLNTAVMCDIFYVIYSFSLLIPHSLSFSNSLSLHFYTSLTLFIHSVPQVQCLHRWSKVLHPDLKKGPWTDEVRNTHKYTYTPFILKT